MDRPRKMFQRHNYSHGKPFRTQKGRKMNPASGTRDWNEIKMKGVLDYETGKRIS